MYVSAPLISCLLLYIMPYKHHFFWVLYFFKIDKGAKLGGSGGDRAPLLFLPRPPRKSNLPRELVCGPNQPPKVGYFWMPRPRNQVIYTSWFFGVKIGSHIPRNSPPCHFVHHHFLVPIGALENWELYYGTLHWPLILSLYQKKTIKSCYFQYAVLWKKQTKKNHLWRPRTYILNNRGCYLKSAALIDYIYGVFVLYYYFVCYVFCWYLSIPVQCCYWDRVLLILYQKFKLYDTKMFEITSFLHPNCDNLEAKKQFCIQ